jgi:hypothetical protein
MGAKVAIMKANKIKPHFFKGMNYKRANLVIICFKNKITSSFAKKARFNKNLAITVYLRAKGQIFL